MILETPQEENGLLLFKTRGVSMYPTILTGDTLLVKKTEGKALKKGDVAVYKRNGLLIAHRVIGQSNGVYLTRGDMYMFGKERVSAENIIGRALLIKRSENLFSPEIRRTNLKRYAYNIMTFILGFINRIG